jgi:hypothetical protein
MNTGCAGSDLGQSEPYSGVWSWGLDYTRGIIVGCDGTLMQKGDALSGFVVWGVEPSKCDISDGSARESKVRFTVSNEINGIKFVYKYIGAMDKDRTIKGTVQITVKQGSDESNTIEIPWTARRKL